MYIQINTFEFELEKSNQNSLIYLYESKILTPKYYMPHLCINNEKPKKKKKIKNNNSVGVDASTKS